MKYPLIVFFSFFIFSCNDNGTPKNVLPPQKMKTVLWDFLRAEELSRMQAVTDTSNTIEKRRLELYNQLLAMHKISDKEFKKSFEYYQQHPALLKEVLDSMRRVPVPVRSFKTTALE